MFKKANALLLFILSTIITSVLMLLLQMLMFFFPWMQFQAWFMFGHLHVLYLVIAALYAFAGCVIGIITVTYKDAVIKALCVGFGLFPSFLLIGMMFDASSIPLRIVLNYFFFSLPCVALVIIAAVLVHFSRSRVKRSDGVLLATSAAVIFAVYIALSIVFTIIGQSIPELDIMLRTPAYRGVQQQIVQNSQFQLERDPTPGREDYFIGLGTFPAIGYCPESAMMVSEFCHQHLDLQRPNEHYDIMQRVPSNSIEQSLRPLTNRSFFASIGSGRFRDMMRDNSRPMDIVIIPGRPAANYRANNGEIVEITSMPIALDALVFIVHRDNPIDNLTTEQVRDIYSGRITNWQELGGNDRSIRNYQRNNLSHTYRIMNELVMQGMQQTTPIQVRDDRGVMRTAAFQNFPGSIGYCLLSHLNNNGFRLNSEVKILSIDGVFPDEASIRNGTYPLAINFYAAIRKGEEDDVGGRFLEWILSDEGQACIRQSGYLPLH